MKTIKRIQNGKKKLKKQKNPWPRLKKKKILIEG
jgi:hypothetical protein